MALMSQIGSIGSLGGASGLGIKTAADMYVGMLQSQTISDAIIQQFGLKTVYNTKKLMDARRALKSHTEFETGKDGLIQAATDHDPKRASDIANAYVREPTALTHISGNRGLPACNLFRSTTIWSEALELRPKTP